MSSDRFDQWFDKITKEKRTEKIPPQILERLPQKVLARIHKKQKIFFGVLSLILILATGILTVIVYTHPNIFSFKDLPPPIIQELADVPEENFIPEEELIAVMATIEEEKLWQLGQEIYSTNLEMMDWIALTSMSY
jgi:hypothetical protein